VLYGIEHRRLGTVARLLGDPSAQSAIETANGEIERGITSAQAIEDSTSLATGQRMGEALVTTKKWEDIKTKWQALKGRNFSNAEEADAAHQELTAIIIDLILTDAGNNSNLILDPDLNSYWLMDQFVIRLPALGEAMTRLVTLAMLPANEATVADRQIELAGLYKTVTTTISDLEFIDLKSSYEDDRKRSGNNKLQETLDPPFFKLKESALALAEMVKRTHMSRDTMLAASTSKDLQSRTSAALKDLAAYYDQVGPKLREITVYRVNGYRQQKALGVTASVLAIVLMMYLFAAFYISVQNSVLALGRATQRMIAGTTERFALASKDELGQIADSYNSINTALVEARTLQKRVQSENEMLQENIMDMLKVVAEASDGNFTVRARISEGALGNVADAFNHLLESLQQIFGEIQGRMRRTNDAIGAISQKSLQMASGATNQAREVLSATQLVQRMSTEIERVASNANNAASAAKRTEDSAMEGTQAVEYVISGMEALRANVQAGAKKIKNLGDRSMEVTGIVGVINRISEQTNMLALNAAIEAARAGEHGRGFSVVAEEVRKLAERTATATQEIDKLVKAIHVETNETVHAIEQQTAVVEQESVAVGRAGESLNKIREVSTQSAGLVADISSVAKAQVEGTKAVVNTMGQISSIAQATQAGAEGTASTIKELVQLSEQLAKSMSRFRV
jgi:methyl-accepting chemotaxis protein